MQTTQPQTRRSIWPTLVIVALFLAAALPLILTNTLTGRFAWDQVNYHEKVVRTFMAQWPHPDLTNYLSATTPLYHLMMAAVGTYISDSTVALRLAGCLFTVAFLAVFTTALSRTTTPSRALLSGVILGGSLYFFTCGAWLLPDNAAWLGVLVVILLAWPCRFDARLVVGGGITMALLVLTRQTHIWAAAPLWAAAWMSVDTVRPDVDDSAPFRGTFAHLFDKPGQRLTRAAIMFAATLPAFAILLYFRHLWGDRLYPPAFDVQLKYPSNPAMPVFIFAVFGTANLFFAVQILPRLARLWRVARPVLLLVTLVAIAAACLPHTTLSVRDGRFSGIWAVAGHTPSFHDRSPAMIGLAVWGVLALLAWCAGLPRGPRLVVLAVFAGFTAAMSIGHLAFERYIDTLLLMLALLLWARTAELPTPRLSGARKLLGPAVLALGMVAMTAMVLRKATPVHDEGTSLNHIPLLPEHEAPK